MQNSQIDQQNQPPENQTNTAAQSVPPALSSVGTLLKAAWKIYRERFGVLLSLMAMAAAASVLLVFSDKLAGSFGSLASIAILIFLAITLAIIFWAEISLLFAIRDRNQKIGAGKALAEGSSKIGSYIWISILAALISAGGFVLFVIPGIIFSVWFSLAVYVLVMEDFKGMNALWRSKQLISDFWWPVFGRVLLMGMIVVAISLAVSLPATYIWNRDVAGIASSVISFLFAPFAVAYYFLIFADLQRIKKGNSFVSPSGKTKAKYALVAVLGVLLFGFLLFIMASAPAAP